jgi:hypothetical protein
LGWALGAVGRKSRRAVDDFLRRLAAPDLSRAVDLPPR